MPLEHDPAIGQDVAMLKHGPYVSPVVVRGVRVECQVRGIVRIVGMSDGPIRWPIGEADHEQALVVFKGLATAVRDESPKAVAAAWGVPLATAKRWQTALEERPAAVLRPGGRGRRWTPEDDARLLATPDTHEAAQALRRTPAAVRFRRKVLRETRRTQKVRK